MNATATRTMLDVVIAYENEMIGAVETLTKHFDVTGKGTMSFELLMYRVSKAAEEKLLPNGDLIVTPGAQIPAGVEAKCDMSVFVPSDTYRFALKDSEGDVSGWAFAQLREIE